MSNSIESPTGDPSSKQIYPLMGKNLPDSVGNKAKNINLLQKKGYLVPPGFVFTWESYLKYCNGGKSVLEQIRQELNGCIDPQKTYAVRSSANVEDSLTHSFAGQFETILAVRGVEQILSSILSVWEAAGSESIRSYLTKIGKAPGRDRLFPLLFTMAKSMTPENRFQGGDRLRSMRILDRRD